MPSVDNFICCFLNILKICEFDKSQILGIHPFVWSQKNKTELMLHIITMDNYFRQNAI